MPLLYTTSDVDFARTAVAALNDAGIEAYFTGEAQSMNPGVYYRMPPEYCIFSRSDSDSKRAAEILIQLGAVPSQPLPSKRVLLFAGVGALLFAIIVVVMWTYES